MKLTSIILSTLLISLPSLADETVEFKTRYGVTICETHEELSTCSTMAEQSFDVELELIKNENDNTIEGQYRIPRTYNDIRTEIVVSIIKLLGTKTPEYNLFFERHIYMPNGETQTDELGTMLLYDFNELVETSFTAPEFRRDNERITQYFTIAPKI